MPGSGSAHGAPCSASINILLPSGREKNGVKSRSITCLLTSQNHNDHDYFTNVLGKTLEGGDQTNKITNLTEFVFFFTNKVSKNGAGAKYAMVVKYL